MGWHESLQQPLARWSRRNHAATFAIDPDAMGAVACELDQYVRYPLHERREAGPQAPDDVATHLMRDQINRRPLTDDEITSIARNWTVGELGTIAASVGIVVGYLCEHPALQTHLRSDTAPVPESIDEILRLHGPLVLNRRRVMRPTTIHGRLLLPGERLALLWPSANRDENAFEHAHEFRFGRAPSANLLYGAGIHACPGAPLARLELRVMLETLLQQTAEFSADTRNTPTRVSYPSSGFATLPVRIRNRPLGHPVRKARPVANTPPARQQ